MLATFAYNIFWATFMFKISGGMNTTELLQGSSFKPNGAHGVARLPRRCWIPPILTAFISSHGLAVCTPQYCTGHQHEQAIDSIGTHFRE